MYRSQSQQRNRFSYQNISSRMNRLRTFGTPQSSQSKPIINSGLNTPTNVSSYGGSRPTSCYRSNLKVQQGGLFGLDLSNNAGKVAKNTGIRKYNQRHIKETLNRNSQKMHEQHLVINNQFDIKGNYKLRNQKIMLNGRQDNNNEQNTPINRKQTIKLYDYIQQNETVSEKQCNTPIQELKGLEPGKIYTVQQLGKMM